MEVLRSRFSHQTYTDTNQPRAHDPQDTVFTVKNLELDPSVDVPNKLRESRGMGDYATEYSIGGLPTDTVTLSTQNFGDSADNLTGVVALIPRPS